MVLAEDLQRYLAEHGMPCRFQGASGISVDGFSSLFHYRPGTMTFIVPERSFSDYAANFHPERSTFCCSRSRSPNQRRRKPFYSWKTLGRRFLG